MLRVQNYRMPFRANESLNWITPVLLEIDLELAQRLQCKDLARNDRQEAVDQPTFCLDTTLYLSMNENIIYLHSMSVMY